MNGEPRLVGVGVGPGDPELLTLAGRRELCEAGRVFVPVLAPDELGRAEAVVRAHLPADSPIQRLVFALSDPVDGPQHRRHHAWDRAAEAVVRYLREHGGTAAFATLGDPAVYSTFGYLAKTVRGLLPGVRIPVVPMIGTIGVAPPEPGEHSVVPPRRWGGNMDIRQVGPGARLVLPVGVEGALLSLGDAHAAMGDGEVCGTGIETSATVTLRVSVDKGAAPAFPLVETDPLSHRTGRALAATGIGPDLMQASRDAVTGLLDEVCRRTGLAAADAYLLASVAADLKISEIVDVPNWVVSAHLELDLIDAARGAAA